MNDLTTIPGVGKSIAKDLEHIGIHRVVDLQGKDGDQLYNTFCAKYGPTDRCLLYVFRCAVYFASHKTHDPKLLKWWNWKERS